MEDLQGKKKKEGKEGKGKKEGLREGEKGSEWKRRGPFGTDFIAIIGFIFAFGGRP